jgi:hypothetical protein
VADAVGVRVPKILLNQPAAKAHRTGCWAHDEGREREQPGLSIDFAPAEPAHETRDLVRGEQFVTPYQLVSWALRRVRGIAGKSEQASPLYAERSGEQGEDYGSRKLRQELRPVGGLVEGRDRVPDGHV